MVLLSITLSVAFCFPLAIPGPDESIRGPENFLVAVSFDMAGPAKDGESSDLVVNQEGNSYYGWINIEAVITRLGALEVLDNLITVDLLPHYFECPSRNHSGLF